MLQSSSVKIRKVRRKINDEDLNFVCGGCKFSYRSYPALYLHIKRKHNGVKPPNTKSSKLVSVVTVKTDNNHHGGRPLKPSLDVDNITEKQIFCERAQSDLLGFLAEKLEIVTNLGLKPKLKAVTKEIQEAYDQEGINEFLIELKEQAQSLLEEITKEDTEMSEVDLDFENFGQLDKKNSLKILCWFLLWLGKYIVRLEALRELTLIFSKIWKVIKLKRIEVQDLDNKLIWNQVVKELEPSIEKLKYFGQKRDLVYEFVSKTCHLIGNIFE